VSEEGKQQQQARQQNGCDVNEGSGLGGPENWGPAGRRCLG
jgi:hypothetical protein